MILVTFALAEEGRIFQRRLTNRQRRNEIICGWADDIEVGICHLGIRVSQRARLETTLRQFEPSLVLSSGFAGGTRALIMPGDFVLSENFSELELVTKIKKSRLIDASGAFSSVSQVAGPEEKMRLNRVGDSVAVDMESAILAGICRSAGTPLVTVRMISDTVTERVPKIFLGARSIHPAEWIEAARFAGRMLKLTGKLARRLEDLLGFLHREFAFRNVYRLP